MVDALVIAGPLAGWVVLYIVLCAGPRLGHRRDGRRRAAGERRAEPPAVLSWLAGRLDRDGFPATLIDLAARGWCRFGTGRPVICELTAEAPIDHLMPYERRAASHLAQRAGSARRIPADALLDGFAGGEEEFRKAFKEEVITDARARGLTRPTLSNSRKGLLCLLAFVPPGAALLAEHATRHSSGLIWLCVIYFAVLCGTAAGTDSDRLTPAGQAALEAWDGAALDAAHATALGRGPALFTSRDKKAVWSGYGDNWRQLTIRDSTERTWPGLSAGAAAGIGLLIIPGLPLLGVFGYLYAGGGHGTELGLLAGLAAIAAITSKAMSRWAHLPRSAEFDGLVLRQWQEGTEKSEDGIQYYVAVDDGVSEQAWAFSVGSALYARLVPGTIVHTQVNPRLNKLLAIELVRQLPVAPLLDGDADPRDPRFR